VGGINVLVPVGPKDVSVEDKELSRLAVERRAGLKAATAAFGLRLAVDYVLPAAAPEVLASSNSAGADAGWCEHERADGM
jgi:hypothetical protein